MTEIHLEKTKSICKVMMYQGLDQRKAASPEGRKADRISHQIGLLGLQEVRRETVCKDRKERQLKGRPRGGSWRRINTPRSLILMRCLKKPGCGFKN
jgi:hypothetical protein